MPNFMKIGLKIKISKKYFWTPYNFWLLNSIPKMHLNTKFYLSSSIGVTGIKWQKNEKLQNANFHENRLKNQNFKKIFLDHL